MELGPEVFGTCQDCKIHLFTKLASAIIRPPNEIARIAMRSTFPLARLILPIALQGI
jgi:hypothetical protein